MSVCTDAFRLPAAAMAKAYQWPDFEFVMLPHPIASLTTDQIQTNVRAALPEVLRILGVE